MSRGITLALLLVGGLVFAPPQAMAIDIQRVISPGGIEGWLVQDPKIPVLAVHFSFSGGVELDPPGKEGLALLTASLLDEGAGPYESQAFQRLLEDNAISLNFSADRDLFFASFKTLTETRNLAVDLMHLALTQPRFDDEAVERMRTAALTEVKKERSDPQWLERRAFNKIAFANHPYGSATQGTLTSLPAITTEDMHGLVRDRFGRDTLLVTAAGDITAEAFGLMLDQLFGELPAHAKPYTVPDIKPQGAGETIVVDFNIPQSLIIFGEQGVSRKDPDWWAARLMNYVLGGGGFTSRLMEEVREKRGLSYGVGSSLQPEDHANLIVAGGATANKTAGETLDLMKQEWARMRDGGVTAAELANAKTYMTGSMPLQFTSTDAIANVLLDMRHQGLPINYLDHRTAMINNVTQQDVARVAKRILDPTTLLTIIVGKPAGVTATKVLTDVAD